MKRNIVICEYVSTGINYIDDVLSRGYEPVLLEGHYVGTGEEIEYIKEDKVSIGIFPEGSRSKDGQLQEFKPGAFKIAEKALCPVIVCSMKGTINIHKNWPWKKTEIYMDILDVIDPSIWKEKNTVEVSEYAHNLILNNITLS